LARKGVAKKLRKVKKWSSEDGRKGHFGRGPGMLRALRWARRCHVLELGFMANR
jgi:hypothetical protein